MIAAFLLVKRGVVRARLKLTSSAEFFVAAFRIFVLGQFFGV